MPANRPEDLHALFLAGVAARDLDAIMKIYEPEPVGMNLAGEQITGHAAMREFLGGFLSRVRTMSGSTRRVLISGDLALISNSWQGTITGPDGQPLTASGTTAEVARRQPDGTWRLVIDDPAFIQP